MDADRPGPVHRGYSGCAGLLADKLEGRGGDIAWGELVLVESARQREIGMSFYARWTA